MNRITAILTKTEPDKPRRDGKWHPVLAYDMSPGPDSEPAWLLGTDTATDGRAVPFYWVAQADIKEVRYV